MAQKEIEEVTSSFHSSIQKYTSIQRYIELKEIKYLVRY